MESGLEAVSTVADHAAVGAFFGACWALATGRTEALNVLLAQGMVVGGLYGVLMVLGGVDSWR